MKILFCTICFGCLAMALPLQPARAAVITVGTASGSPGDEVSIPITIDRADQVAAAAFTITYDTRYLSITGIASPLFTTFSQQWQGLQGTTGEPPTRVTVEGITYTSPLLHRDTSEGTAVAGCRIGAGSANTTLFTLRFSIRADTPGGTYPIGIIPTKVTNTSAGYPAGGEDAPSLLQPERSEQPRSYPVLTATVHSGTILVDGAGGGGSGTEPADTDHDGIADEWEYAYFGTLDACSNSSDHDGDGYTDYREYLNSRDGVLDPAGQPFDPTRANAPFGVGYRNVPLGAIELLLKTGTTDN